MICLWKKIVETFQSLTIFYRHNTHPYTDLNGVFFAVAGRVHESPGETPAAEERLRPRHDWNTGGGRADNHMITRSRLSASRIDAALFSAQIAHFQKELDDLKTRCRNADFRVGSTDDMKDLRKDSENLNAFTLEIKDTTEVRHTHCKG